MSLLLFKSGHLNTLQNDSLRLNDILKRTHWGLSLCRSLLKSKNFKLEKQYSCISTLWTLVSLVSGSEPHSLAVTCSDCARQQWHCKLIKQLVFSYSMTYKFFIELFMFCGAFTLLSILYSLYLTKYDSISNSLISDLKFHIMCARMDKSSSNQSCPI